MTATALRTTPAETTGRSFRPHRLTVERYCRMIESGILAKERVFLWGGELVEKMTSGPDHIFTVVELDDLVGRVLPAGWHIRQEKPVAVADDKMPEPDLVVLRGANRDYRGRVARAQDVALIIEVSDTSLAADSGEKLRAYATQAIPIYWIVNLPDRRIEVYTDPTGPADVPSYRNGRHYAPGEEVPVVLDGREVGRIAVTDVLP